MAELTFDFTGRTAAGRQYVDPSDYVKASEADDPITSLTNSLHDTTVDDELEDVAALVNSPNLLVDAASRSEMNVRIEALNRDLSELHTKLDAVLSALRARQIIQE